MMTEVFAHYSNPRVNIKSSFKGPLIQGLTSAPSISLGDFNNVLGSAYSTVQEPYLDDPINKNLSPLHFELDEKFEHNEKKRFITSVEQALKIINDGRYEKIVLSRRKKAKLISPTPHHPHRWINQFFGPKSYGHQFLWQQAHQLYLSLTPESLFEIDPKEILIDALAGTTKRGHNNQIDEEYWQSLVNDPKERHEHQCVRDDIKERLDSIGFNGEWKSQFEALKLEHIQHIHSQYLLKNRREQKNDEGLLIKTLHPTAAVGARPNIKVLELLEELEGYKRGPYAAPHVIRLLDQTIVIVGLRCCLVEDDEVTLFAGAGIVKGSDPEKEWLETERKCRNFL